MFIIPMAGLSSRFSQAGYTLPKYQLSLHGETVFGWSVRSFENYFTTDKFVFIYRQMNDTAAFLETEIARLGIVDYTLVCLDEPTQGQADTVYQGLRDIKSDEGLYIFNIDSQINTFIKPSWVENCDGYLQVFKGEGEHWSFVQADAYSKNVIQTTEKERISDLCSNGLYYFKNKALFERLFLQAKEQGQTIKNEFYIAPLYNALIAEKGVVYYDLINAMDMQFCGTPEEYQQQLARMTF
ncbi:glycosyltransferase family 2 protein [Pelistega suis]|uniref:Capsular biosynthesis protein n=1 Tax=Pelistega suis TaxID=1631957 RepID=A0A849PA19_9BURK|nr:glycosyltransferase family 2 protein [Pelistega suis]NOL51767.1 capsular biosynthesis protein [Pelistega suis]